MNTGGANLYGFALDSRHETHPPVIFKNLVANVFGKLWILALNVAAVPVYVHFLGVEAYGLIGFLLVLQATLQVLELGLGVVASREVARTKAVAASFQKTRDLIRTLEAIYWTVGALIGLFIFVGAPLIAANWLQSQLLEPAVVERSIRLMGLIVAFQWPTSLYVGCLIGLERQVLMNFLQTTFWTLKIGGAILVVWLVRSSLEYFFAWMLLSGMIAVAGLAVACWSVLPHRQAPAGFSWFALRGVWRFAAGMGATGVVTFLLSSLDKLILSKFLPLAAFGQYNVAAQFDAASRVVPGAIYQAVFPHLSSLHAHKSRQDLAEAFHQGSQLISLLVIPASMTMALFSTEILALWLQDQETAQAISLIVTVLIVGSMLNAMVGMPYQVTLACGWSIYGFYQNTISAFCIVPLMLVLVHYFGGLGAAIAWLALNIGYYVIAVPIMVCRTLDGGQLRSWYWRDTGVPLLACLAAGAMIRSIWPSNTPMAQQLAWVFAAWAVLQASCLAVLPLVSHALRDWVRLRFGRS